MIPNLAPRPASTRRRFAAFIVERRGRLLLRQRPEGVVNARLWELPNIEKNGARLGVTALAKRELGTQPADVEWLCTVRHSITRYRIQLDAYRVKLKGNAITTAGTWIPRKRAARLAFASAHRKVLAAWDSGLIIPQPG